MEIFRLLVYCTSNGTHFFVFKILHEGFFTLKICMRIDIAKPELDLNFGGECYQSYRSDIL